MASGAEQRSTDADEDNMNNMNNITENTGGTHVTPAAPGTSSSSSSSPPPAADSDKKDREDTEDTEDTEDRGDREDTEDREDREDTEDRGDREDTEDRGDRDTVKKEDEEEEVSDFLPSEFVCEPKSSTASEAAARPGSLALQRPQKKKVLVAPALSLSLGRSESTVSDDFPPAFLSPSPEDGEDAGLDLDLDALETPSDSESLPFPIYDLEEDMRRLGVASRRRRAPGGAPGWRFGSGSELGALEREDMVDGGGTRWRCFSTGVPPQEGRVNMSVLQPFLRVLSHGGYYGDGMNDIIVFSSCYLPQNNLDNYQYVMDHLFRYVVGTLDLMVAENYVIVYLCAGGQKDKLPGISWLRECYTTIDRRLRKNLKGFYVVHPTWYIKALITIIKPFISSKFSRKLQFVDSLQSLSVFVPTEHVQIPDCVTQYDRSLSRGT